jgi:hypothetical protein
MSLSSFVEHLIEIDAYMVRRTTQEELEVLSQPHPSTGLPLYRVLPVYLTESHKSNDNPLYMIFVDNGLIYYCEGDVLSEYTLDDPSFFHADGSYHYEAILEGLFLNGGQDIASFAGFFMA